jgi:hypothetical protein
MEGLLDDLALPPNVAPKRSDLTCERQKRRCFAGSVRTQHRHEFTGMGDEVEILDDRYLAITGRDVTRLEGRYPQWKAHGGRTDEDV